MYKNGAFAALFIMFFSSCFQPAGDMPAKVNPAATLYRKIIIVPLGKVNSKFIKDAHDQLLEIIPNIELRNVEPMPDFAFYKPRKRYRADSLIAWMRNRAHENEIWLGITMNDISTTKGEHNDFGVMGLGYCPGSACVASDFRLRNKKMFYKVMIHELGHTTGLPHCSVKTCYMTDAEGGDPTDRETGFGERCTKHLILSGWRIK